MMHESVEPLDDAMLSSTVIDALEVAAGNRGERPLDTLDILLAVVRTDLTWGWESVQMASSFISERDADLFEDPSPGPAGNWHGAPLTATATRALEMARGVTSQYRLNSMPAGVLALGLLGDPASAASRAMLTDVSISHPEVLDLIQENVLDTDLEGLDLSAAGRGTNIASADAKAGLLAAGAETEGGAEATEVLARARQIYGEDPGSLAVLIAAIQLNGDPDLRGLLESMLLDPDDLPPASEWPGEEADVPGREIVQRARERFDQRPDPAALIVTAAAAASSPALTSFLKRRGMRPRELAAQIAEWRLRREGISPPRRVAITAVLSVFGSIATSILLMVSIAESRAWWQLVFLLGVWSGYPKEGPLVGGVVAVALFALAGPVVGIAQSVNVFLELGQARIERDTLWANTGIKISLREQRHVVARLLTQRGRQMQSMRLLARLYLRGLLPR